MHHPGPRALRRRPLLALAAVTPLAACATSPDAAQYLAADDGSLKRSILGARSALSHSPRGDQLADVPRDQGPDALQRQFVVQQALSESPLAFGNQVKLLRDGAEAFPAMFAAMRNARDHINLEYYILQNVAWGGVTLSEVLIDRLRRGVAVNIIYDGYGSADTQGTMFDLLRSAGARIVVFNPLDPNHRDHRKIMVVDGRIGFTGGINLDKVYENPLPAGAPAGGDPRRDYWRDTAIRIEGPAVAELQKLFFATWQDQHGPPVAPMRYLPPLPRVGVQTIRIIGSAPHDERPLYYISLIAAILSAEHNVWLSSGYFVPTHEEREDLAKTARAGVDMRLVLPGHTDVQSAVYAARAAYGDLLDAGAHIYEMENAVLHSKLATVDGVWSVVGSSNLDRRSAVFNNEVDAIILGNDTASQVETVLREDMPLAREITKQAWRDRGVSERFEEIKARLWEYWM